MRAPTKERAEQREPREQSKGQGEESTIWQLRRVVAVRKKSIRGRHEEEGEE